MSIVQQHAHCAALTVACKGMKGEKGWNLERQPL